MKTIECPRCKGNIELEHDAVDKEIYVCEYCGARIRLSVKSSAAMTARVRVKELEHEEAMADKFYEHEINVMDKTYEQEVDRDKREEEEDKNFIIGILILIALCFAILGAMSFFDNNPGFMGGFNQAQVSKSASQIRGTNHDIIESELRGLGFYDIESQGLGDKGGWFDFSTDGDIDYISINGDSNFKENTWFSKDSKIIIKYHSYPDQ